MKSKDHFLNRNPGNSKGLELNRSGWFGSDNRAKIPALVQIHLKAYFTNSRLNVKYVFMKQRQFWLDQIHDLWGKRGIVWLAGVRRIGKTSLANQIEGARYFNCDLPSVRRQLEDPEFFYDQQPKGATLIFDEIQRLDDPSLLLKIAADEYSSMRILATGSSTLEATKKFKDALTGRKHVISLPPVLWRECLTEFEVTDFDRRLLHGGFPELLLAENLDTSFYEEWMDSFYARDIQELFRVRNRTGFLSLLKLLCMRSGGQLDLTNVSKESGLSRPTVMSHLEAMEIGQAILRIPPFHGGGHREIVKQPKVYVHDTGLIAHVRGWEQIREADRGHLWENLVLDELKSIHPLSCLHHWRDKKQHEIDFVVDRTRGRIDTVEAKINPDAFEPHSLKVFREAYPKGKNLLVCPFVKEPYKIRSGGFEVIICSTPHLPIP